MNALNEIQNYINNHFFSFSVSGTASAGFASVEIQLDYLKTHALGVLSYSEWIQIVSAFYVLCLLILTIPKVINVLVKGFKLIDGIIRGK